MSTVSTTPLGRPRLFDEETVLTTLTAMFWRQGYGNTSMTDIVDASGMHKPSLYRTFGSKEELFARVLRRYLAERIAMFTRMIEQAGPGIVGVHTFLTLFEADAVSEHGRDGCLMVMASNELRGVLPGYEFSADYRKQMGDSLRILVAQAVPGADDALIQAHTDLVTTYLLGLHVVMRGGADADEIHRQLHALHVTVDAW